MMNVNNTIILFDDHCNLCNSSVSFILKRDKKKQFDFVPLQSEKGKELIVKFQLPEDSDSVIVIRQKSVFIESDAALEIGKLLPPPWSWVVIFKLIPKGWRDNIYRWVAKNRYRWFGKRNSCRII